MPRRLTQGEWVEKARNIHGDKYDYSLAHYINNITLVELICPMGHHFWVRPDRHSNGQGCSECAKVSHRSSKGKPRFNSRKKLIYGVGVNDYKGVTRGDDKCYSIWRQILARCYDKRTQETSPTYVGCSICEEWKRYSVFKEWFDKNYIEGYALDKDIAKRGNKVYCPQFCNFIPREINALLNTHKRSRGRVLSLGVSLMRGIYVAQCSFGDGNPIVVGRFRTEQEAFQAYKNAKENYIKKVAQDYYDRGKIGIKIYESLMSCEIHPYD